MKKGISIAALLTCVCIVACIVLFYMHKEPYQLELVSQDEFIFNQLTTKIRFKKVDNLIEHETEMTEFLEKLGITKYKCYDTIPIFYTIIDTPEYGLLQLEFDSSGKYFGSIIIGELSSCGKTELEQLQEGMTLSDVFAIDPKAKYTSFSWSQCPQMSYHFSSDGYAFRCRLESDIVTGILSWTI